MLVRVKENSPVKRWYDTKHNIIFDISFGDIELPEDFNSATLKMYIKFNYLETIEKGGE